MRIIITETQLSNMVQGFIPQEIDEVYPTSWSIEEFKKLRSFNARVKYCTQHLQRIASGSSRIVFKIDDEKVLKLAFNAKGLAQNSVEIGFGNDYYFASILAQVFDSDDNDLWVEMELARKIGPVEFRNLTGTDIKDLHRYLNNKYHENRGRKEAMWSMSNELIDKMDNNEFVVSVLEFMLNNGAPSGDFGRISSYGVVKRDGHDVVVLTDYGLTEDVYNTHYRKRR